MKQEDIMNFVELCENRFSALAKIRRYKDGCASARIFDDHNVIGFQVIDWANRSEWYWVSWGFFLCSDEEFDVLMLKEEIEENLKKKEKELELKIRIEKEEKATLAKLKEKYE